MGATGTLEWSPATAERPHRAERDAAASAFKRRVKATDRVARTVIAVSGIAIICAVLGIGLFLFLEVLPLFQGARVLGSKTVPLFDRPEAPYLVIADEYQQRAIAVAASPSARVVGLELAAAPESVPIPDLDGAEITAAARNVGEPLVALGTSYGVWVGRVALEPAFDGATRRIQPVIEPSFIVDAAPGRRINALAFRSVDDRALIAGIIDAKHVIIDRVAIHEPLVGPQRKSHDGAALSLEGLGDPTAIAVNGQGNQVWVGTTRGLIGRFRVPASGRPELIEAIRAVPGGAVASMAFLLGDRSIAIGGSDGSVATWSLIADAEKSDGRTLVRIHRFPAHASGVRAVAASPRDKGFVSASDDGVVRLHYMTSERTLASLRAHGRPVALDFAPKADGILAATSDGAAGHWRISNPHPEISWKALFGEVWYEGYASPGRIWQSSGGTDDFEPKFSMAPLMFGTFKGTLYAMLFAVPFALLGALYCSQFLDKRLRTPVKSTVELMAALPSVVLGFITGVLLAPLVQMRILSVLMMPIAVPLVALGVRIGLQALPVHGLQPFLKKHEFWILIACAIAGIAAAWWAGPWAERILFDGSFESWLSRATGTRYDQRNALVVGWAMGFAVIPIIFTICEDAFSAVPRHLVGASLACGASAWQTAWRVVLPAAGSGVFSAVMIGFGRAVGETMIVLMATGNTPVMDWSAFNGFRALSANIAVEIPEAPYGGTLYRVLFIAALLLFMMTSVVNTAAEVVRLRLRKKLQGL